MCLDGLLDFPFHGFKVEARRRLHRGKLDGSLRQLRDLLLNDHEPPEFATHEVVHVASAGVVQAFTARAWRPLKRILADIDDRGHVGGVFLARPPVWLLEELELKVVVAKGAEMRTGEIED